MKRTIRPWLLIVALLLLCSVTAYGDIGPKPSVIIDFRGLEGERYYATLLSTTPSTGPHTALTGGTPARVQEGDPDYHIFQKFAQYEDPDGLYFLQFFQDCSQSQQFRWTYYPPPEFKLLLYFPDTGRFVVGGEQLQRYAFHSYFTATASNTQPSALTVAQSTRFIRELLPLGARALLTIAIELAIAWAMGFRGKKLLRFIALVNLITQLALNLALGGISYRWGPMALAFYYLPLELLVFFTEAVLYTRYLKRTRRVGSPRLRPVLYALAANAASFALGLALARWIPIIF